MKRALALAVGSFVVFVVACGAGGGSAKSGGACPRPDVACPAGAPSFDNDVQPIFVAKCSGCHAGSGSEAKDHDLGSFETIVAARNGVREEIQGCGMPPSKAPPLTLDEAKTILGWIACGAKR